MSNVVPRTRLERLAWYETRLPSFTTNAVAIGTTAAEVAALEAKVTAARAAREAQELALAQAKARTAAYYAAMDAVTIAGAGILKQVRARGETTGDPTVYELAMIPAPAIPEPKGPPGTPSNLKVELDGNGTLHLKWKCSNPPGSSGTVYQVFRQIGGAGEFKYLGGAGEKSFVDSSVPAGATQLTYQIQAVRSTAIGMWATFNVNFGTNTGGAMTASVTTTEAPKLAA